MAGLSGPGPGQLPISSATIGDAQFSWGTQLLYTLCMHLIEVQSIILQAINLITRRYGRIEERLPDLSLVLS